MHVHMFNMCYFWLPMGALMSIFGSGMCELWGVGPRCLLRQNGSTGVGGMPLTPDGFNQVELLILAVEMYGRTGIRLGLRRR